MAAARRAYRADAPEKFHPLSRLRASVISPRQLAANCFHLFRNACLAVASREINKQVARRDAQRGGKPFRWFTPEEAAVAEALARIIVPSDEETPGIDEVGVLGTPAIAALDNLIANSCERQSLYSRGLLSFDRWALHQQGCKFAEMPAEHQIAMFKAAEKIYQDTTSASRIRRSLHRLLAIALVRKGALFAAELYQQIRDDCFRVFYTSRVSWIWLEYDGPPMDKGYPSLVEPR